jgi:hypothetical protein
MGSSLADRQMCSTQSAAAGGKKISQAALSWHDDSLKMISLVTTLCAVYNSTLEL